jgi:ribosome maturation factor RimP
MERQHTENLFRRYKGEAVNIKTVSGGIYQGKITEVTNDYVCLVESGDVEGAQVFMFFSAIESLMVVVTQT